MGGKGAMIGAVVIAPIIGIVMVIVVLFAAITGSDDAQAATCGTAGTVTGSAVAVQTGELPAQVGPYSGDQVKNAAAIISIGKDRGLTQQAQQTALMAAMTESTLNNNPGGDRDSAGLFQMRPSQGWGTLAQVTDISYAINLFYERLVQVPGWESKSPGEAAQAVERSAFPDAYATKAANAVEMMNALSGVTVSTVAQTDEGATCTPGGGAGGTADPGALADGEQPATGPTRPRSIRSSRSRSSSLGSPTSSEEPGPMSGTAPGSRRSPTHRSASTSTTGTRLPRSGATASRAARCTRCPRSSPGTSSSGAATTRGTSASASAGT
ncbi:hypothetical protein MAFF212519_02090 [Clavibacter michiganensis]